MRPQFGTLEQHHRAAEKFAAKLDAFLRARFHYKREVASSTFATVQASRAKVKMYLRLQYRLKGDQGFWPQGTLVIASIQFREKRKGSGRAFLEFLIRHADEFGYDKIGVECTISRDGIQGFCRRYFQSYDPEATGRLDYNWLASVSAIARQLVVDSNDRLETSK